jgi:hypothetical protein
MMNRGNEIALAIRIALGIGNRDQRHVAEPGTSWLSYSSHRSANPLKLSGLGGFGANP